MRLFGFRLNRIAKFAEPQIPDERLARLNHSFRRRLDDDIEAIFNRACISNELEVAAELFAVLENNHMRRVAVHGVDGRLDDTALRSARCELEKLIASRERPAMSRPAIAAHAIADRRPGPQADGISRHRPELSITPSGAPS